MELLSIFLIKNNIDTGIHLLEYRGQCNFIDILSVMNYAITTCQDPAPAQNDHDPVHVPISCICPY